MRDKVYLSKKEYLQLLKVLDMMVCILDRSEKRENADNRAYSLAIACAETDMVTRLANVRKLVVELITPEEISELDNSGIFDYEIPQMPYEDETYELRKRLEPYLVNMKKILNNMLLSIFQFYGLIKRNWNFKVR